MYCMNAFVHDLHHCTKLQLSTRCSFGVMTQTRHKFQSGSYNDIHDIFLSEIFSQRSRH